MAAGASPERAQQFTTMAAQKALMNPTVPKTPTLLKPRGDIEDAFDTDIAAASFARYPNTYRPPDLTSPEVDDYIAGVYGEDKLSDLFARAYKTEGPNFYAANQGLSTRLSMAPKDSQGNTMFYVSAADWIADQNAGLIPKGESWATDTTRTPQSFDEVVVSYINAERPIGDAVQELVNANYTAKYGLQSKDLREAISKLYQEAAKVKEAEIVNKENFLKQDKYYQAKLPHPNLVYGRTTDLRNKTIAYNTNPAVANYVNQFTGGKDPRTLGSAAGGLFDYKEILNLLAERKQTPFTDEVVRRQRLGSGKGKKLKQGS